MAPTSVIPPILATDATDLELTQLAKWAEEADDEADPSGLHLISVTQRMYDPPHIYLSDFQAFKSRTAAVLLAGALAGFLSDTALHPIETVSHRAKVHPSSRYGSLLGAGGLIMKEEGVRGLWAGVSVTATTSAPVSALYFGTYYYMRDAVSLERNLPHFSARHSLNLVRCP